MTTDLTEITVIGGDKTGLIARVTTLLFERGINIEDLDQAVRDGLFRMSMRVDTEEMTCEADELRSALLELGRELGVDIQVRFPSDRETQRIAVCVTKESHCLEALMEAADDGDLDVEIAAVISNRGTLRHLVEPTDIPFYDIGDGKGSPDEDRMLDILAEHEIDLIALARYMRILGPKIVFRYEDRIINIHPSLLPAFPGAAAYRQAKEEGVRIGGVTAHYVTTDLDQGPIITQRAFDIPDDATIDDIKARGQPLEAEALLEAIELHTDDTVAVHRGRTSLRDGADAEEYQLGLPETAQAANPKRPVDTALDADVPNAADD
ncbi:formyltetrahydrofolate deformylase [Halovenus salina]|uniref:formyltetrahydrofolate deformylase n=1 Tax=Halovenus salina TaxID=1510225 RepID=UPI002260B2C3|nr:formyltetrahydrofolate deformylase [Halovenus salina]